jgi:hypothetical protein
VVTGISKFFDQYNTIGAVLALPLLWTCLDPETGKVFPENNRIRICSQYENIRILEEGMNPVKRIPLSVYRVEEQLLLVML